MKTSIYLLRHGEVHNPKDIVYGRLPRYGLSEKGKKQIAQSAHYLADKNVTKLYSSPLLRAKQSMEIIRQTLDLPNISFSKDLLEVFTSFQGISHALATTMRFDWFFSPKRKITDETMEQIRDRMDKFIHDIHKKHPGETIAVLSHGDPLMILKAYLEKRPLTLDAVREGHYLAHGEVLHVTIDKDKTTIKSVFIPKV